MCWASPHFVNRKVVTSTNAFDIRLADASAFFVEMYDSHLHDYTSTALLAYTSILRFLMGMKKVVCLVSVFG